VITVEPILGAGGSGIREGGDGWTIRTADGALAAHTEHTIVVTGGRPLVLTA
jgi:methionyl aminopeptidase